MTPVCVSDALLLSRSLCLLGQVTRVRAREGKVAVPLVATPLGRLGNREKGMGERRIWKIGEFCSAFLFEDFGIILVFF